MAHDVLHALSKGQKVEQTSDHDVESLAIALVYAVLRKLRTRAEGKEKGVLEDTFRRAFGHHSVVRVLASRSAGHTTDWVIDADLSGLLGTLTPALRDVLVKIDGEFDRRESARKARTRHLQRVTYLPPNRAIALDESALSLDLGPMSYEFFSGAVDEAIAWLKDDEL